MYKTQYKWKMITSDFLNLFSLEQQALHWSMYKTYTTHWPIMVKMAALQVTDCIKSVFYHVFYCVWIVCLPVCLCTMYMPGAHKCRKRTWDHLELELQITESQPPCRSLEWNPRQPEEWPVHLTCWGISPILFFDFYNGDHSTRAKKKNIKVTITVVWSVQSLSSILMWFSCPFLPLPSHSSHF